MALSQIAEATTDFLKYNVTGLDGKLKKNVEVYLSTLSPINSNQLPSMAKTIDKQVMKSLQALGYYDPKFTTTLADENTLVVNVDPGEPVKIAHVNISIDGEAGGTPVFKRLIAKYKEKEGDVLNHSEYESLKSDIQNLATSKGYFDAVFVKNEAIVDVENYSADINIIFDSGIRYHFGSMEFELISEKMQKLILKMADFKEGEPFNSVKLSELNKDIASTGYFTRIDVEPDVDNKEGRYIPIKIVLKPNRKHEFEVGAGYSTDEGPRFSMTWEKPLLNERGHSLKNEFVLSKPRVEVTSNLQIPAGDPLRQYYSFQNGYQYKNMQDTESNLITTSLHRWSKHPKGWDWDMFVRLEYEAYKQGLQDDQQTMVIPGVSWSRSKTRGGLNPYQGNSQMFKVEFSNKAWGSGSNFVRLWGQSKWLETFHEKHRIVTRFEQGYTQVDNIEDLPPSLRFFTGGDISIRGFAFESVAPEDSEGNLIGGKYLTVGSLEYNYAFKDKWWLATFVDTGTATNDYKDRWKVGTGVGIRWDTALGQIKLDLAFGVSEDDYPWQIHFSMGSGL